MTQDTKTPYEKRCEIVADLWIKYGDEPELSDFMSYNDLGLVLGFAIHEDIVKSTTLAEAYVNETFDLLLEAMGIDDTGFETVEGLLESKLA
jgi:hypothetical protein